MNKKHTIAINQSYNDTKTYADQDLLQFEEAKNAFLNTLINIKPPASIALYGSWGSGKSWMIEGLIQGLNKSNCLTLTLDAWKYRHEKHLILPLMYRLSNLHLKGKPELKKSFRKVIRALGLTVGNVGLKLATGNQLDLEQIKNTLEISKEETLFDQYTDHIESIENHYMTIINDILGTTSKEKLVIFIDNLDRCLPDVVLDLLEDISNFLTLRNIPCLYVLAMDKENILKAIQQRFPEFDGSKYLEKIIQVPLKMPISGKDNQTHIYYFMKKYERAMGITTNSNSGDNRDKIYNALKTSVNKVFNSGYLLNPRRIDLIVNKFVTLILLNSFRMEDDPANVPIVLFLLLIQESHQNVFESLNDYEDYIYLQNILKLTRDSESHPSRFKIQLFSEKRQLVVKNFPIANEYANNSNFYNLLDSFSYFAELKDSEFSIRMKEMRAKLQLIG